MFGNLFKKKYPSKFLDPNPMTTIFTLPDKFINHQVMSPVFNNKEQQGLYKLFRENVRKISSVTHLKRDTYKGEEFLCFAEFIRYGDINYIYEQSVF